MPDGRRSSAPPPPFPLLVSQTPTTWRTEVPLLWSVQLGQSREKFREKQCCPVSPNPRLFSSLSSGQTVNSPPELSPAWLVIVPKQGPKQDSRAAVQVRSRPPQCLRCENVPKKQKSPPRKSNLFTPWSLSY